MADAPFYALVTPIDPARSDAPGRPVDPGFGQKPHPIPPHIGGGPVHRPSTPGQPVDPNYGAGHPLPPHIGGAPVEPPPHVGGGPVTPPGSPTHPTAPDGGTPMPPVHYPPTIWPPDGPQPKDGDLLLLAWIPGHGLAWVVVDTDLMPSNELPKPPAHVGGGPAQPPSSTKPPPTPPGAPAQPVQPTPAPKA
jgi:hypothetical protein